MTRIAITTCSKLPAYEEAIRRAGGEPVIVNSTTDPGVIRSCAALLLTGGGDLLPSLYGEPTHPAFDGGEPGRDEFELTLANQAVADDLPLLAICRGIQVLNVARGGTLIQDIPSQIVNAGPHSITNPPDAIAHGVTVAEGSLLQELLGDRGTHGASCPVNGRHHQAVKAPGRGLVVTATAPDGVIEAIEDPSRRFCLGVQWHPENFSTGEFSSLFAGLVNAGRAHR